MTTRTGSTDEGIENQWGGFDWPGSKGLARLTVEDGETTVMYMNRYGHGELLEWQVEFSSGAPRPLIDSAIAEARRLADGRVATK